VARHTKYEVRITRAARRDVVAVVRWSLRELGEGAALRYDALLTQENRARPAERAKGTAGT